MYYLKYRPSQIKDIDNQSRQELLLNIFSNLKDTPHAFLLVGPKGTGKTSTARIIAKVLNCEQNNFGKNQGTNPEPCNQCENCQLIDKNAFLDVYELDAASNRGIDDIRSLKNQVAYAPTKGKFKVYIIDEVHMLTKEAFNALLKTLEEPPPFVVFILATTEPHKLPETIVSRCLTVSLNKAKTEEIINSLQRIVKGEKLKIDDKALVLLAAKSQGSFRDGAKLLELAVQSTDLSAFAIKKFLANDILSNPEDLLALINKKEQNQSLLWLKQFSEEGGNSAWLIEELLVLLHEQLLTGKGQTKPTARLIKVLLNAYQQTRYSPIDILPLMIAVVEYLG